MEELTCREFARYLLPFFPIRLLVRLRYVMELLIWIQLERSFNPSVEILFPPRSSVVMEEFNLRALESSLHPFRISFQNRDRFLIDELIRRQVERYLHPSSPILFRERIRSVIEELTSRAFERYLQPSIPISFPPR